MTFDLWETSSGHVKDTSSPCFSVNYLYLVGGCAFSLFLSVLRIFSWFLNKSKWLIHDWCVVDMGGQRAGWAGCWTPCRWGTLGAVKSRWCWYRSLGSPFNAPAQHPLSPEMNINHNMLHFFDSVCNQSYFCYCIISANMNKLVSQTFPPVSDLFQDCACVSLDTLLGLELGRCWCACICLRFWDGADLNA